MTLTQRGELVVARFFEAVGAIEQQGVGTQTLCRELGIDKRNFYAKRKGAMGVVKIPVSWLSALCATYKVSAKWLLLGRGKMFE